MPIKEIEGYAVVSPENEMLAFCVEGTLEYRNNLPSCESNEEKMIRIRNVDRKNRRLVRLTLTSSELTPITDSFKVKKGSQTNSKSYKKLKDKILELAAELWRDYERSEPMISEKLSGKEFSQLGVPSQNVWIRIAATAIRKCSRKRAKK